MIHVTCNSCSASFSAKDELAGRRGKCPSCGEPIVVPAADTAPAHEPTPAHAPVVAAPVAASAGRRGGSSRARSGARSGSRRGSGSRRSKGGLGPAVAVIGIALAMAAGAYFLRGDEPAGKDAFMRAQSLTLEARWDEAIALFEQVPPESTLYALAQEELVAARDQRDASRAAADARSSNALYAAIQSIEKNYVVKEAPTGANYSPYARYLLTRCAEFVERFPDDPRGGELKQYGFKYAKVASLDRPPTEADVDAVITFRCLVPPADGAYAACVAAIDAFAAQGADNADAVRRLRAKLQTRTLEYWQNLHARMQRQGELDPGSEDWQRVANETSKYLEAIKGLPGLTPAVEAVQLHDRAIAGG